MAYVEPQSFSATGGFEFRLPADLAGSIGSAADVAAEFPDGRPLPEWLTFDPTLALFAAEAAPTDGLPLEVVLRFEGAELRIEITPGG